MHIFLQLETWIFAHFNPFLVLYIISLLHLGQLLLNSGTLFPYLTVISIVSCNVEFAFIFNSFSYRSISKLFKTISGTYFSILRSISNLINSSNSIVEGENKYLCSPNPNSGLNGLSPGIVRNKIFTLLLIASTFEYVFLKNPSLPFVIG